MCYEKLKIDLLKTIRGDKTQQQVNKKLGFDFNQVSRWETQQKRILWPEFVRYCELSNINITQSLKRVFTYHDKPEDYKTLVRHLSADKKMSVMSNKTKISRYIIRRWMNNTYPPTLEEMFQVMEVYQSTLINFIDDLVGVEHVKAFSRKQKAYVAEKNFIYKYPYFAAVALCLELKQYKRLKAHQKGFIAKRIGISQEEEEEVFKNAVKLGLLEFRKKKYYKPPENKRHLNTKGNFFGSKCIKGYWLNKSIQKLEKMNEPKKEDYFSYFLFNTNETTYNLVLDEYIKFFKKIIDLVVQDNKPTYKSKIFSVQYMDVE